jgi:hypothetical protein
LSVLRLLDSERGGDEVAGDLLDLMGNGGVEIIEELLQLRKEITGVARTALRSLKSVDEGGKAQQQHRMPSYGTQVRARPPRTQRRRTAGQHPVGPGRMRPIGLRLVEFLGVDQRVEGSGGLCFLAPRSDRHSEASLSWSLDIDLQGNDGAKVR